MPMFTPHEKKNLSQFLARAVNKDEVLSLDELHGFLFGLAIIPELVMPREWLPCIFGQEMPEVANVTEGERLLGTIFSAYNRIIKQNQDGVLSFPFGVDRIESKDIQRIREWTHGLFLAICLRPEVWGIRGEGVESSEDAREMMTNTAIIMGIVFPEEIPELFPQIGTISPLLGKKPV